jgi:sporulation protein YunB
LWTATLLLTLTLLTWIYIERHIKPILLHHAGILILQTSTESINTAITEQVSHQTDAENLIDWHTDTSGKVSGFTLNYLAHMRIAAQTTTIVERTLAKLQAQHQAVPLGQVLGSTLLTRYGPSIPVSMQPMGAVKVDLKTRHKNAGINMVLVEVYVQVTVDMTVLVPLDANMQTVQTELPISYVLVVGGVPDYINQPNGSLPTK